ncbi:MAG: polyprenyl diphosphate synthase [Spirochaetales bacterium]
MSTPQHVGIIMDGNGRWATRQGKDRSQGHLEGLKAARRVTRAAAETGIRYLTLYVFSTENHGRPVREVEFLMGLIGKHLEAEMEFYHELDLRVVASGDLEALPANVQKSLRRVESATREHGGMTVNLALNHGGRDEIARAVRRWMARRPGEVPNEADLASALDHPEVPDLDLVIRTSGEQRLSNFQLWRAAYAEFSFSETLWPDWTGTDLNEALAEFARRKRNFGKVSQGLRRDLTAAANCSSTGTVSSQLRQASVIDWP